MAGLAILLSVAGCEDSYKYSHDVPVGKGSIVVDNQSATDVDFFLGGILQSRVGDGRKVFMDLDPGLYRMVLDEHNDYRHYSADIDILEGRLTVVRFYNSVSDINSYSVYIYFQ